MEEKDKMTQVESGQENVNGGEDYIKALKEMKERTVSKEQYDKLKAENCQLLQALVNGETIEQPKPEENVDLNELRKSLFSPESDLSNLQYMEKTLKLRQEIIKQGGRDPFLPIGEKVNVTHDQIEAAERSAQIFQECVDFAQGDSGVFTAELQRRTKDVMPRYGRK